MDKQQMSKKPEPVHEPGTKTGEEIVREEGKEPGLKDIGTNKAGRPIGVSDARDDDRVGAKEPIDPASPHLQAP